MRKFRDFSLKEGHYRIASSFFDLIVEEIILQREYLEEYIQNNPEFGGALTPIDLTENCPPIALRMQRASLRTGVGPMAAVAGAIAQKAVEVAMTAGAEEAIVDNGGDIYAAGTKAITVGIYPGRRAMVFPLALKLRPEDLPLALCSSSSRMGHSKSFGDCDLVTIASPDAALADAAATMACNKIRHKSDIEPVLEFTSAIPGIQGVLVIHEGRLGMTGKLPEIVRGEAYENKR